MSNDKLKTPAQKLIGDGNEGASWIAYKCSEVAGIYPITPSSNMGENADMWAANGVKNIWGNVPEIMEMQSEAGAAGTVHGALAAGAMTTTFTASQGLLLKIPNMYKIAGELLPTVVHISARTLASHALSIFGDHQDVMAARQTGFAMLFGNNVQEAHDMAMIAHATTLKTRVPFMNIFDGFRTSHEISKVDKISDEVIREMIDEELVIAHRERGLNPDSPEIRGTAQNPDVFFQNREASNKYYEAVPDAVQDEMNKFAELTGRQYKIYEYYGAADADRVIVMMGSGAEAAEESVDYLNSKGEKVGLLKVRLYRPLDAKALLAALPRTVKAISVLDRTKEMGQIGEPLFLDVVSAFHATGKMEHMPTVVGGRYGLSSKEFTPTMVNAVYENLQHSTPKNNFTVGIKDDVTHLSLDYDKDFAIDSKGFAGLFYGLGSDGTVGANKNSIKIIGETTDNFVQGYFVYDSKKSGSTTTSHLRFGPERIKSTYLVDKADFIACHVFEFLTKFESMLEDAKEGSVFLLNSPYSKDEVWSHLPKHTQQTIIDKKLQFYVIDATTVAMETGMGSRTNTILQTCFFHISGILPADEAVQKIKDAIVKSYSKKGDKIVQMNFNAVDQAVANLHKVEVPAEATSTITMAPPVPEDAPEFVKDVIGTIISGKGDELPVSAFTADGTFPTGTTKYEKSNIATMVPVWDMSICTQCNKCSLICPHAAIRPKVYSEDKLADAPETWKSVPAKGKEFKGDFYTLQVAVEDCTGCEICVSVCPAVNKEDNTKKAINMAPQLPIRETERENWNYFLDLPNVERTKVKAGTVKGSQFLEPLFEFSGACSGCGETPYIKLITQLYGDEMVIGNATGCSSIYGGNLPTTPYTKNEKGRGPAWANSLFEDNAEFGLGMRLALDKKREKAFTFLAENKEIVGEELFNAIADNGEYSDAEKETHEANIDEAIAKIKAAGVSNEENLKFVSDNLRKKAVWIIGGDGWAYDIGYGGLDHAIASGKNVNILVMDTEVYSNTGGQASKSTPIGASAKFAEKGKVIPKKDLALQAITYGDVYVAQIAMGAKDAQTVKAIQEAANYDGPSIIIAYSHCIAHGYNMKDGTSQQEKAVASGHWPLYRFDPTKDMGKQYQLDSKAPTLPLEDYIYNEARYASVKKKTPELAADLLELAKKEIDKKWFRIESLKQL
ncbi:MAG: pyruvate:ferredoxin (flavodoxin) oxidoreductase [Bacteroidota bacterium]